MAQFINTINQKSNKEADEHTIDGMANLGKIVPNYRRNIALSHCRDMGLTDTNKATGMINRMCEAIHRDEPYNAMEAGMAYLDLIGTYRLLAVLLTALRPQPTNSIDDAWSMSAWE